MFVAGFIAVFLPAVVVCSVCRMRCCATRCCRSGIGGVITIAMGLVFLGLFPCCSATGGCTGCRWVGTQWAVRAAGWLRGELVA